MDDPDTLPEVTDESAPVLPEGKDPQEWFTVYQNDPTPANMTRVLDTLKPAINQSLAAIGESGNSMLQEQARLFTIKAVKSYDPTYGASLHTWTRNQLRQLSRAKRKLNSPIKVPERIQLDAFHLSQKEKEFFEINGREPSVEELADASGLPVKRIAKVRTQFMRAPGSGAVADDTIRKYESDYMPETLDYVYGDSDYIDKKIMEHRMGYGGAEVLSNNVLANKLNVRPDVLSKRWGRINHRMNLVYEKLRSVYN